MSFTANTAFEARITNNEFDELCNVAGKYYASDAAADCSAGWLCVTGDALACEGFSNVNNENCWKFVAATSSTEASTPIYACNTYETQYISDGDNLYHIGSRTLGLGIHAGRYGNWTIVNFDGKSRYRFGVGNISGTISTNQYFTIDAGQLKVAAAAPSTAGMPYFKLAGTGTFVEGASAGATYYDVIACKS